SALWSSWSTAMWCMLTFREVIQGFVKSGGVEAISVRGAMDDAPMTCTMETDMDEVRRMMLDRHARYMPVMDKRMLMGVISLYDVARPWWTTKISRTACSRPIYPRLARR
ncbi:CBS domain-containing protein, partial [Staphylococcus epidermidis]|nr:CBS domain-containing protein [Staphylococcus epidermidis]